MEIMMLAMAAWPGCSTSCWHDKVPDDLKKQANDKQVRAG